MKKLLWSQWGYMLFLPVSIFTLSKIAGLTIWGVALSCVLLIWFGIMIQRYNEALEQKDKVTPNEAATETVLAEEAMRLVNLHRHEWMNDIQLLIGYAGLKKYDKLQEFVEQMKVKANEEATLFKIGDPHAALYIYTLYAERQNMQFKLEVAPDLNLEQGNSHTTKVGRALKEVASLFKQAASQQEDNQLTVVVGQSQASSIELHFEYRGVYDRGSAAEGFSGLVTGSLAGMTVQQQIFYEDHAEVKLQVPVIQQ